MERGTMELDEDLPIVSFYAVFFKTAKMYLSRVREVELLFCNVI